MNEISQAKLRIRVTTGNEDVVFICRQPSAKEVSKFLASRFVTHRNKQVNRLYEARQSFIDSIIEDVENVSYRDAAGNLVPLHAGTQFTPEDIATWSKTLDLRPSEVDWKALIPLNWKSSAAMFFEDSASGEADAGN